MSFFRNAKVRGSALRDEFSCPITRELMRDPVIAADGHTYDREAIEMWLRNHDTSPKVYIDNDTYTKYIYTENTGRVCMYRE